MKKIILKIIILSLFFALFVSSVGFKNKVLSQTNDQKSQQLSDEISKLEKQIADAQQQVKTLSGQITYMNNQIHLTELQIEETQEKLEIIARDIEILIQKISRLESSLDQIAGILLNRVKETYITGQIKPLELMLSSNGFSDFLSRLKYIKAAQAHDKKLMYQIQTTKANYEDQKKLLEEKKKEQEELKKTLEGYKTTLASQKKDKEYLLETTKNDEAKYQQLLAAARSELEAIQAIIAGQGDETEVGKVNEGDKIASVIQGSSCNSSGTHIHFMVAQNAEVKNPFNYLKGGVDYENCSGSSCGSSDGDPFSPSGDWNWPLNPKIKFFQGYGNTWSVNHTWVSSIYTFHNGIDFEGSSSDVKAVKNGTLYRGSYIGKGCSLRYVRVRHDDSDADTYYLHVNYF